MKRFSRLDLFPWLPLAMGLIGIYLRCLLFDAADPDGMLPIGHPADSLCYLLLAAALALCFFLIWPLSPAEKSTQLFPDSRIAAIGGILGAVGIGCSAFFADKNNALFLFVIILGTISAICLGVAAYLRLHGIHHNCLLHAIPAVYFMVRTIAFCQKWGTEPQLQLYFFNILASLFILIACYYRAELDVRNESCKKYLFFSQAALFCCCMCLNGTDWLFYLSAILWLATDRCVLKSAQANS